MPLANNVSESNAGYYDEIINRNFLMSKKVAPLPIK